MPNMADVTVKKADGTTNVTFVAKVPSSGEKSPAIFTQDAASTIRNQRPTVSVQGQSNGPKTARRASVLSKVPVLRTVNGVVTVAHEIPVQTTATIPNAVTDAEAAEAIAQHLNLCNSTLIRDVLGSGYAPT